MNELIGILSQLKTERYFYLGYLIDEIQGFSFEKINGMSFIRLLDPDLISIMQKYFPNEDLSIILVVYYVH